MRPAPLYNVLKRKCGFSASVIQNPDIDTIKNNVDRVIKWAKDHPVKTRQSELLKMFPNAPFYRGVVSIPPCSIEKEMQGNCLRSDCYECRRTYWLTEVADKA